MKKIIFIVLFCLIILMYFNIETNTNVNNSNQTNTTLQCFDKQIINYENGDLHWYTCLDKQKLPLLSAEYDINGNLISTIPYINGKIDGQVIKKSNNRTIIQNHKNGNLHGLSYIIVDNKTIQSSNFFNGILHGDTILNLNEEYELLQYYNGKLHGKNILKINNTTILEINYNNGNYDGEFIVNNQNENILNCSFNNGKLIECKNSKYKSNDCLNDPICFSQNLKICQNTKFHFGLNQKEQIITLNKKNNEICQATHNFTIPYKTEPAYYACPIPIKGIETKNINPGLNLEIYDLWIDLYLETNCNGTVVNNIIEKKENFFNRFSRIDKLDKSNEKCLFSNMCGENFHCKEQKCVSNYQVLERFLIK